MLANNLLHLVPDTKAHHPWVEKLFNAIDNRNWQSLSAMLADDVVYDRPGYPPLVGRQAVMDFYRHDRIVRSGRHFVEGFAESLNTLTFHGSFQGISKTGANLEIQFCDVCEISGQLLKSRKTFFFLPGI